MIVPAKITGTSPASATTAAIGSPIYNISKYDNLVVFATLQGATGGTLDVYLQTSFDGGTTWYDWVHFTQIAAAGASRIYRFSPSLTNDISTVGSGTSPALSAGSTAGGPWGDQIRCIATAGAGTSAGAAQTILIYGVQSAR